MCSCVQAPQLWAAQVSVPYRRTVPEAAARVRGGLPAGGTGDWLRPHLAAAAASLPRAGTAPGPGSTRGSAVPTRSGRRQRAGLARFISPPPHHLGALSFLQQNPWLLSSGVQPPVSPAFAALGRTEQGCWVSPSEVPTLPEHWMAFTVQPPNPRCFTAGHAASQIKLSWARQVEEKIMCLTPKTGLVAHTG